MSAIRELLTSLRRMTRNNIATAEALVKNFKSEIKSLQTIVNDFRVTRNKFGFIELSENSVGKINTVLRSGDLVELIGLSGRPIAYTSADVRAFKSIVKNTPEATYKEIIDTAALKKQKYPQLDVTVNELNTLSTSAAKDVAKVESNFLKCWCRLAKKNNGKT